MPKIVEKKAWYQMSDEEKAEYDAKVQAEVDASGGKLKKRRKRRKDAKSYEQVKAEIDAKEAAKAAKKKPKFMPTAEAFNIMNYGLSAILETTRGLQKAFEKRAEREQKLDEEKKLDAARLLQRQKAKDEEKKLEEVGKKKGGAGGKIKEMAKKGGMRILTAIVAIIAGFLINQLPKIMKFLGKVMDVLKGFWKIAGPIFETLFNIISPIVEGLAKLVMGTVDSGDAEKQLQKNKSEMEEAEESLKDTKKGLEENIDNTKKDIEDTKKDLQKRVDKGQTPEEIVKEKTGQEVKMKGESDKKEDKVKQKNDVKEKQETLKKETKEQQVVMKEEIQPQDEPKPKLVIESPPASVEGTLTVKMDEKAGVGDGKSAKKVVTPQGLGMDMYSKPITLGDGAAEGWKKVLKAAAEDGVDLTKAVVSSTRTPEQQQTLMDNEDGSTVIDPATPGTSEHVKGRALDIAVNTPEHEWMINNASKYGWKWQGVSDPFHFNFIGADSAETKIANRRGGRDRRMQKQIDREKDLKVLNSKSGRTVVPVPINKIQSVSPPVSPPKEQTLPTSTESGTNLMDTMKTLNTSLT